MAKFGSEVSAPVAIAVASFVVACGAGEGSDPSASGVPATGGSGGDISVVGGSGTGGVSAASGGAGGAGGGTLPPPPPPGMDVGTKAIHRLNNAEYNYTVRDLLGTTLTPASGFVVEQSEDGFDNLAEALGMSALQFADYFDAARALAAEAFANPTQVVSIVNCDLAADAACPAQVINSFGARAFRRPLEQWEADQLLTKYQEAVALGETPQAAMQQVVGVILFSPQFLYRMEFDPNPAQAEARALSGYELASRLSYMLWASMPDETLFGLAQSGELLSSEMLAAQVDRMLADGKAAALLDSFAGQWFGARGLLGHSVDATVYPSWDATLPTAMRREMDLYFSEFLFGDRSFSEFLTADVNFVDPRLAQHYGLAAPAAGEFTRIEGATPERAGFLGLAGFLTTTSKANRTSPIARGHSVLDSVLCVKLTLPANLVVGDLPELTATTTVRDQLAQHRADAACSPCHDQMDPIGLALEKFDAVGNYRDVYENGLPIDTQGNFANGTAFDGLAGLNQVLSQDPRAMSCAAAKLFSYGLGRRVGASQSYVDQIVTNWLASGTPTLRNLFKGFVTNNTFRFRRGDTN